VGRSGAGLQEDKVQLHVVIMLSDGCPTAIRNNCEDFKNGECDGTPKLCPYAKAEIEKLKEEVEQILKSY